MSISAERIGRIIQEYESQGWHRTATPTDSASAEWLAAQARECGLTPVLEPFALSRIDLAECAVAGAGQRREGLPLFDGGFTGVDGVQGRLGALGSDAEIGWCTVTPGDPEPELEDARLAGRHRAILAVTVAPLPGLAPRNAYRFTAPTGVPVLQLDSEVLPWVQALAATGGPVTVTVAAARHAAQAYNVVARLPGAAAAEPLVVMTPRSGWWQCAGERGGGIAVWLECMRALRAAEPGREVVFVATSGHELGHLGLDAFLATHAQEAARASAWVHLGASIGTAREPRLRLFTSDAEMERLARQHLAAAEATGAQVQASGTVPRGESRNIHERGGRYVSLAGRNALFHLPTDRWPEAVDVAEVVRYAQAFCAIAQALARP